MLSIDVTTYSFALIHAKGKTRFSRGKPRNIVWKSLHDTEELTELLYSFRSVMFNVQTIKHAVLWTGCNSNSVAITQWNEYKHGTLMYRSNRSFNIPPWTTPRAFDFFENYCSNSPPTRAKIPFKCPTLGSIQVIKCPHPGDISQAHKWQKDGRNAFSCRTKSL